MDLRRTALLERAWTLRWHFVIFTYLQLLDVLTTLVGLRQGLGEASPFVRMLMQLGPVSGLLISKLIAFGLTGLALALNRPRVIKRITVFFGALVVWNLGMCLYAGSSK